MQMAGTSPFLLATKFHQPVWRSELVSRPRLVSVLTRGATRKLTLVSAPAGFGKSTLLAEWLAGDSAPERTAWVSLDRADNDPALFWTYVITALRAHRPDLGQHALALLRSLPSQPIETVLGSLINELSATSDSLVLVLDDFHAIENRAIHDGFGFLLDRLPPQLRVAVTTRADPPLSLSRLRTRGELSELRAADLRFTPEEAAAFLNDVMGLHLTSDDVHALETRAEGWIAGLQLAALSLRDQQDVSGFIRAFAGDHRYIVDYLLEEVLQQQSEATRAFLLQTSILERMNGPLCEAVTGQGAGAEQLAALERGNFFLIPLDSTRTWFRYHHLFADVLRVRLLAEHADEVASLHARASQWHEQHGSASDAIGHALAAGDSSHAADLVELSARTMQQGRQEATMLGWLDALPPDEIRRRPVLSMIYAGVLLSSGKLDDVDTWLDNAERWLHLAGERAAGLPSGMLVADKEELNRLPGSIAVYRAGYALASGDVSGTMQHARSAVEAVSDDDHLYRGAANALRGLAFWNEGKLESAYQSFAAGMASLQRGGYIIDAIGGSLGLADLRIAQGRLHDAMAIYQQGIRLSAEHGLQAPSGLADMYIGMSDLQREWNDLEASARLFAQSESLGESAGSPQHSHRWRVSLAQARVRLGDLDGACALLDDAEQMFENNMFPAVRPIPALRARVWIAQGRLTEASSWARDTGISADDPIRYLRVFDHLTLARMLLAEAARDRSEVTASRAMGLLERLRTAEGAEEWIDNLIETLMLESLGYQRLGNRSAARASLERALTLAEPGGYTRIFLDEGEPMRQLLLDQLEGARGIYAQRLLRAWNAPDRPAGGSGPMAGVAEPLTPREIEILQLIAAGLRNQEIADRLFISLPTVKRHVANAYGKLGVAHRTEAVARATELGIL